MTAWTGKEDAALREMYEDCEHAEMARVLNRSVNAVRNRCWRLGLRKVHIWTDEDIATLRAAYESARCGKEIDLDNLAARLGRHKTNVSRKAGELGLTDISRPMLMPDQRRIRKPKFSSEADRKSHQSRLAKKRIAENGHPRGALGMKHTKSALKKMSEAAKRAWANPDSVLNSQKHREALAEKMHERARSGKLRSGYTRCAGGKREDLGGQYFRSAWEADYARFLNWLLEKGEIVSWAYEPKTFEFVPIKRGSKFYTPDFLVTLPGGRQEWHEVKGWMDQASKTRLKRMAKYYPDEKIVVIDEGWFRSAARQGLPSIIPNWESRRR